MEAESINIFADYLNPAHIFGPIFDKELRVSSRRRRNYLLRSVYVALLGVFILVMWLPTIYFSGSSSAVYQVSRSALMGKQAIIAIVWLQFIVSQILAIVMLSSSISDEIRMGTLNVLMTTPINSFQIVTGKLFSKLLQVFQLLAISLPLLAIIRVFGGIPWNYLIFGIIITLTSVIFASSLSLFLSVFNRHAYRVVILVILAYFIFFFVLPYFLVILRLSITGGAIPQVLILINPFWALFTATQSMSSGLVYSSFGIIHCLLMLCISFILLGISIVKVRSAALNNTFGRHKRHESKRIVKTEKGIEITKNYEDSGRIKRVKGSPIIWKENYNGFFGKSRIIMIIALLVCLICIIGIPLLFFSQFFGTILVNVAIAGINLVAIFRLAVDCAGRIASEKEARTLPILLVTPLDDKEIIYGKVKAGIIRNAPLFILYIILMGIYTYTMMPKISGVWYQFPIGLAGIFCTILFVAGSGAYFGARMKSSTSAVVATIGFLIGITIFLGIFNPVRLILMIWGTQAFSRQNFAIFISLVSSLVTMIFLAALGFVMLKLSICKLRCNIF